MLSPKNIVVSTKYADDEDEDEDKILVSRPTCPRRLNITDHLMKRWRILLIFSLWKLTTVVSEDEKRENDIHFEHTLYTVNNFSIL